MMFNLPHDERTRYRLLLGLGVVAVLLVLQGILGSWLARGADARVRSIADNGVDSIEQLSRIVHDIDQERIALARHVFVEEDGEEEEAAIVRLEREVATPDADLRDATRAYAPLANLPGEAELWQQTQPMLDRFEQATANVLELSRGRRNVEARTQMSASLRDYAELNRKLTSLIAVNQHAAADAFDQLTALQASTERLQWAIRITGLLVLLLFGWWGIRRIARYEKDLTGYARQLERRNRDLDAFAGRVAHDLKNALGPIVMSPSMLRRSSENPSRVIEIADRTERCSRRANAVIDALLAFSRAGKNAEPDESGALKPIVSSVVEELAPLASQLNVSVEVEEIPDVQLRCNPGLLHIILANLCGNAVKYLEGQTERRVHIAGHQEGSLCRIDVEDTGLGIPKEARGRIFEPFFRVERTRAPGTGIGLATVRRILDARGGRVSVESAEGRGARFSVWLPIVSSVEEQARTPSHRVKPSPHRDPRERT